MLRGEEKSNNSEPRSVAMLVLGAILVGLASLSLLATPLTWPQFSVERNIWVLVTKITSIVCGIGFMRMRRWAVVLYFSMFAIGTTVLFTIPPSRETLQRYTEPSAIVALLAVPLIVAAITIPNWKRLN